MLEGKGLCLCPPAMPGGEVVKVSVVEEVIEAPADEGTLEAAEEAIGPPPQTPEMRIAKEIEDKVGANLPRYEPCASAIVRQGSCTLLDFCEYIWLPPPNKFTFHSRIFVPPCVCTHIWGGGCN